MKTFYITTPIYYVNDVPHIGHAYTTIAADIIARYHRLKGEEVFFLIGTDENAQKNVESALKKYPSPQPSPPEGGEGDIFRKPPLPTGEGQGEGAIRKIVQEYVNEMSAKWQSTWDALDITNDDFIRTTEARHIAYVKKFWEKVKAKGDIYKNIYEGLYCTGCESYKTEAELVEGLCPDHKRAPERLKEENYFFRLTKYRDALLWHIEQHPEFIQPSARRNEVVSYLRDYAQDFSISRKNLEWGIPVSGDETQTVYVWFDALLNYISAISSLRDGTPSLSDDHGWWPADLHLVGKDIIKFHCAYWPAMLMSAEIPLPKAVFAHGFFTVDGQKMSKTIGNVIDPVKVAEEYGNDILRYHLFREISFGGDGDFSLTRLRERYQSELANGLGNLVARVLAMVEKYSDGKIPNYNESISPPLGGGVRGGAEQFWQKYTQHMENFEIDKALELVRSYSAEMDAYIDQQKPWSLAKAGNNAINDVLYILTEQLRHLAWALLPFMPTTAQSMFKQLGLDKEELQKSFTEAQKWGGLVAGTKVHKGNALFPRLEEVSNR